MLPSLPRSLGLRFSLRPKKKERVRVSDISGPRITSRSCREKQNRQRRSLGRSVGVISLAGHLGELASPPTPAILRAIPADSSAGSSSGCKTVRGVQTAIPSFTARREWNFLLDFAGGSVSGYNGVSNGRRRCSCPASTWAALISSRAALFSYAVSLHKSQRKATKGISLRDSPD